MKKIVRTVILFIIIGLIPMLFTACLSNKDNEDNGNQTIEEEAKPISVRVDKTTVPSGVYAGKLNLSEIKIIVSYDDGKEVSMPLTRDMIAVGCVNKLDRIGTHNIDVFYSSDLKCSFQIVLVNPDSIQYDLVIRGGKPVKIDGVPVSMELTNGVFTGRYDNGTEIVIEWEDDGQNFLYWTVNGNDNPEDTQKTTTVILNGNYTYEPKCGNFLYTVSFVTFNDITIGEKKTEYIQSEEDIAKEMLMDDYVFLGWTTDYIANSEEAYSGNEHKMVKYPYAVTEDVTFYGLWMKIGLSYTTYTSNTTGHTVNGYQVTSYTGGLKELSIPSVYRGLPVLSISKDTFDISDNATIKKTETEKRNIKSLTKISIPASVVDIEPGTFRDCSGLQAFYVDPSSKNYSSERGVLYKFDKSILVAYPSGKVQATYELELNTTEICDYAFYNAIVGSVDTVNAVIDKIGNYAFYSIHIDNVDFSGLNPEKLAEKDRNDVIIGYNIGTHVFSPYLQKISVADAYIEQFKLLFNEQKDIFSTESAQKLYVYNYSDTVSILFRLINGEYFYRTDRTAEIIGISRNVNQISIPEILVSGYNEFYVTSIGYYAFKDCIALTEIGLPKTLERVCDMAFNDTPWQKSLKSGVIIANNVLYKYVGNSSEYVLDDNIVKIAESAFQGNTAIKKIDMSRNTVLTSIEAFAFADCSSLTDIGATDMLLIKPTTKKIGAYAFRNVAVKNIDSEKSNVINEDKFVIEEYAFSECYYLETAFFADAYLSDIDPTAFLHTYAFRDFKVSEDNKIYKSYDGILYKVIDGTDNLSLFHYPAGKIVLEFNPLIPSAESEIEDKVIEIGDYALYDSNIVGLVISSNLNNISSKAVNIPGLTYIVFQGEPSNSISRANFINTGCEKFIFENEEYAVKFFGQSELDSDVVAYVNNYTSVYEDGIIYYITDGKAFVAGIDRNSGINELTIPETIVADRNTYDVITLKKYSLYGYNLRKLSISGIGYIESNALKNAFMLTELNIAATQEKDIPVINRDSLGDKFNVDLRINVNCDAESYFAAWSDENGCFLNLFTYKDTNDEIKRASKNLIVGDPFIVFSYKNNEGTEKTESIVSKELSESVITDILTELSTKKEGYSVSAWRDDADVLWTINSHFVIPYNMVLTCEWKANEYTITFNLPEGVTFSETANVKSVVTESGIVWQATVVFDSEYDISVNDSFSYKYDFIGWKKEGDEEIVSLKGKRWSAIFNDSDIVLVPVRPLHSYILEYDTSDLAVKINGKAMNELSDAEKTVNVYYGEMYSLAVPQKTGYKFRGWRIKADNFRLTTESGYSLNEWNIVKGESVIIVPEWESLPVTVTLKFDEGESEESVYDTVIVYYGSNDFAFSIDKSIVKDNYIDKVDLFAGWKDSSGKIFTDSDGRATVTWDIYTTNTYELYAIWPEEISSYTELVNKVTANPYIAVVLTNDIVINEPINIDYKGVLNGGGHTVEINQSAIVAPTDEFYTGIFKTNSGTIRNIDINVNIDVTIAENYANSAYIGGIVAINKGIIKDVEINVGAFELKVLGISSKGYVYSGSLSGQNSGEITEININIARYDVLYANNPFGGDIGTVGSVVGANGIIIDGVLSQGLIEGKCSYRKHNSDKEYSVYYEADTEATEEYNKNRWETSYVDFYCYKGNVMTAATSKFDTDCVYYKLKDGVTTDYFDDALKTVGEEIKGVNNITFSSLK